MSRPVRFGAANVSGGFFLIRNVRDLSGDRNWSAKIADESGNSLIRAEISLIADLNSLQGRIIFVRMRRELASNRFGIEVIPAFRGEKVSERVAAE